MLLPKPNGMPPFSTHIHKPHKHIHKRTERSVIIKVTLTEADMTEPSRGLFYLPIIYLWTGKKFKYIFKIYLLNQYERIISLK